jgi:lysophospholipase L1-like esterase
MSIMLRFLFIAAIISTLPTIQAADEPLHIACIGDSITQGRGGDKPELSWRYPFWKLLIDNEIDHIFVGSMSKGFTSTPLYPDYKDQKFSNISEGHWGWTTAGVNEKLPGWVDQYKKFDIALVQLGSNDGKKHKKNGLTEEQGIEASGEDYKKLIAILRRKNPKVKIVFGECMHAWKPFPALNTKLKAVAKELSTEESPIVIANLSKGWISDPKHENTDTIDWVHTSVRGDKKIADEFWKTLKPLLKNK